jgi:hypothetical protein
LDLVDTNWSAYRGAGGMAYPHPITMFEQAALLRRKPNTVTSRSHWAAGRRIPGVSSTKVYTRGDFEESQRAHAAAGSGRPPLRLVTK